MGFEERYNNSAGGRPRAKSRADRRRSSQGLEITHFRGVGLRVRSAIQFPPPPPRSGRKFGPYFEHPRGLWQGGPVFSAKCRLRQALQTRWAERSEKVPADLPTVDVFDHPRSTALLGETLEVRSLGKRPRNERAAARVEFWGPDPRQRRPLNQIRLRRNCFRRARSGCQL